METKKLLQVGVGKTGNVLLNDMMNMDGRYVGLFINTAKKDMVNLENFNDNNYYKIPQVDGTGRDRNKAKEYVLEWQDSFIDLMLGYDDFETVVFYFSMDGGSGSGASPTLMNMVKNLYKREFGKDVNIIAVAVMPKTSVSTNGLNNTKECWNDLMVLRKNGVINTLYLVDNNKRDSYDEINKEVVEALDTAFAFDSYDIDGELDTSDSKNINLASGYNLILKLDDKYKKVEDAILDAQEKTVFVLPSDGNYFSQYLGVLVKEQTYATSEIITIVGAAKHDTYEAISEEEGFVFFGGLKIPKGAIEVIDNIIEEREKENNSNEIEEDLLVSTNRDVPKKEKTEEKQSTKTTRGAKRIRQMAKDSLFEF